MERTQSQMIEAGLSSRASAVCLTGMIVERPAQRLQALAGDATTPGLRLLNRPLVAHQQAFLRQHGVTRLTLASHRGATLPVTDVADGGPVLVLDGDVLTDADVSAMLRFHAERAPAATVMLARNGRTVDGGVYIVDAPLLGPLLARRSTSGQPGFLAALLAEGLRWIGWCSPAYWRRIHTPAAYHAAHMDLLYGRASMLVDPPGRAVNGSWIGEHVTLGPEATIEPPSVVGAGAELGAGARVGPRAVIGSYTRLGPDVRVTESILGEQVVVGASAILDGCIVGGGARIAPFSILAPGAVLASGAVQRSRTLLPR
jgi:NDP-sugar pyrophosphorylase family protein